MPKKSHRFTQRLYGLWPTGFFGDLEKFRATKGERMFNQKRLHNMLIWPGGSEG
jgi:hypothetical protein